MRPLQYPRGAWDIAQARASGLAPAGPVIVVCTERYRCLPDDSHVFVEPGKRYRWDWLAGLRNVVVVIDAKTRMDTLLADIEAALPGQTDVIDVERLLGWQVISAKPGRLRTVKWPRHWVQKWLTLDCGPVPFSSV